MNYEEKEFLHISLRYLKVTRVHGTMESAHHCSLEVVGSSYVTNNNNNNKTLKISC